MRFPVVVLAAAAAVAVGALGAIAVRAQQGNNPVGDGGERTIRLVAKRFVFTPSDIVLKKGQPVVFELTTLDFGHGFSVPDLDFRADFVPEKTTIVRLTPKKAGRFEFLCDNFCGSGHEEMDGHLVVEE